jgi:two-component system cell cycle sensor histidine kinase/response regulator CckA
VLLVDYDGEVRSLFRNALTESGFDVVEAGGSFEAIRHCRYNKKINVLIADVDMADLSGIELADYLHKRQPEMRVIFISGAVPEQLDPNAILLTKPFTPATLIMVLRDVLGFPPPNAVG